MLVAMLSRKVQVGVLILMLGATTLFVLMNGSPEISKFVSDYTQQLRNRCACEKCISEGEEWFMERFKKSPQPFLSPKYNLSEEDFNYWKKLQYQRQTSAGYKAAVNAVFHLIPDPEGQFIDSDPGLCRTCAVVGNSGNLKGSHYGDLIDLHDVIIRMNRAPTKGFEKDVGSRTTHHVIYPESAKDLDNTTHLVLFPFKTLDLQWLVSAFTTGSIKQTYTRVKTRIQANKDLVMVLNPAFIKYVHQIWLDNKGGYPSTGILALFLGIHMCDEVHVFGYGADKDGNWNHYFEAIRKNYKTGLHGGDREYKLIQRLAKIKKIEFFKGW